MRYEDVEGCLGDEPNDPSLYRREAYPVLDGPTKNDTDSDERELRSWQRGNYSDGGV